MLSKRLPTLAFLLSATLGFVAHAETGVVVNTEYTPIIERSNGQFVSCGIHYSAVVQGTDDVFGVQGSWNSMYYSGQHPGVLMKVLAVRPNGDQLEQVPLIEAQFSGVKFNTFDLLQEAGEDHSRLIIFTMLESMETLENYQIEMPNGFWIFLTMNGKSNDFSFKLPRLDNTNGGLESLQEVANCDVSAMEDWMENNIE
ncbi:hypothetical protein [Hyphomonas atlantica corrig.]|uniref:hypothetical protein n=1 Tax=Hyphomonas atlantica TaxID=1280948 RepID=UPI002352EA4D|nr:hypothetical protein [Hyphomonas atlantica]